MLHVYSFTHVQDYILQIRKVLYYTISKLSLKNEIKIFSISRISFLTSKFLKISSKWRRNTSEYVGSTIFSGPNFSRTRPFYNFWLLWLFYNSFHIYLVMLEDSLHDYHRLTGCCAVYQCWRCMRVLNQTFSEPLLRHIDQLVHCITNECLRKEFDENLAVATDRGRVRKRV